MQFCHNFLAFKANFNHYIEPPQFRFARLIEQCQQKARQKQQWQQQQAAIDCQTARQKSYVNWLIKRDDDDNLLCRLRVFFSCFIFVSFSFVARVFLFTLNALFCHRYIDIFLCTMSTRFCFILFTFLSPKVQ